MIIFSLYAIFFVLFEDVIKAQEFSLHYKIIAYLVLFIFILRFSIQKLFKYQSKELNNPQILITILFSCFLAYGMQFSVKTYIEKKSYTTEKFKNPLYTKYKTIAEKHNLDLSFTQLTKEQRGPLNYKINTIYSMPPKSVDILFIGDSSLIWGTIPEVIEQITDKKIAFFAYESNPLTVRTAKLFNMISKYYLKDNGILVLSFDPNFYNHDPKSTLYTEEKRNGISSWDFEKFSSFAKAQEKKTIIKNGIENKNQLSNLQSTNTLSEEPASSTPYSFQTYQKIYHSVSKYLKDEYHMYLKSSSLYSLYLEKYINPKWNKNKNVNLKNDTTMYLRWNMNTVTLYDPNFDQLSIHSDAIPGKSLNDNNTKNNAQAASNIYGARKILMIPLHSHDIYYKMSRNIYNTYYKKNGFELLDLGKYQPKDTGYPMQGGSHMGNEGGLMKSILIGEWLKENLN